MTLERPMLLRNYTFKFLLPRDRSETVAACFCPRQTSFDKTLVVAQFAFCLRIGTETGWVEHLMAKLVKLNHLAQLESN